MLCFRNPTQYKLDISAFAPRFANVFWMDSDTIIYSDLRPYLHRFVESSALFYLAPDHVLSDPAFVERWRAQHPDAPNALIPQACFMGFKASVMHDFFPVKRLRRVEDASGGSVYKRLTRTLHLCVCEPSDVGAHVARLDRARSLWRQVS